MIQDFDPAWFIETDPHCGYGRSIAAAMDDDRYFGAVQWRDGRGVLGYWIEPGRTFVEAHNWSLEKGPMQVGKQVQRLRNGRGLAARAMQAARDKAKADAEAEWQRKEAVRDYGKWLTGAAKRRGLDENSKPLRDLRGGKGWAPITDDEKKQHTETTEKLASFMD